MRIYIYSGQPIRERAVERQMFLTGILLQITNENLNRKPNLHFRSEYTLRVLRNQYGCSGSSVVLHVQRNGSLKRPFSTAIKVGREQLFPYRPLERPDLPFPIFSNGVGKWETLFKRAFSKKVARANGFDRFHNKKFVRTLGKRR